MPASDTDELSTLSDKDIYLTWDIVEAVQNRGTGPPYGPALFAAYESILEERRIEHHDAQKAFRLLVQLTQGQPKDGDLQERFQQVCERHGFTVDWVLNGDDGDNEEDVVPHGEDSGIEPEKGAQSPRQLSRRPSISSRPDKTPPIPRDERIDSGADVLSNSGQEPAQKETSNAAMGLFFKQSSSRSREPAPALLAQLPIRGRVNGRSISENAPRRPKRSTSTSSQTSIKITRRSQSRDGVADAYSADESDAPTLHSRRSSAPSALGPLLVQHHQTRSPIALEILFPHSETQMLAEADSLQQKYLRITTRRILWHWRDKAAHLHNQHAQMAARAESFDRSILFSSALSEWHARLEQKRKDTETERFFARFERRAGRGWDLYLMFKAFTHWANSAADERARTSVARRHVLRHKFFNAWKEVTVVNEMKVRRQRLHKFFNIWRRRAAEVQVNEERAVAHYEDRVVAKVWVAIENKWLEREGIVHCVMRMQRKYFKRWLKFTRERQTRYAKAEERSNRNLKREMLALWVQKLITYQSWGPVADTARRKNLLSNTLANVQSQAALAPKLSQVAHMRNERIKRENFSLWRDRTQNSRVAEVENNRRLAKKMLITWSNKARIAWLQSRIADRVQTEALYRWHLAARGSILSRVHDANVARRFFTQWQNKVAAQRNHLDQALISIQSMKRARLMGSTLSHWRALVHDQQQRERTALSRFQTRVLSQAMVKVRERNNEIRELNEQAQKARYFLLTQPTLQKWRQATVEHQRLRRRENYAAVRRANKMNLVHNVLSRWRLKTAHIQNMDRAAIERAEINRDHLLPSSFAIWRSKAHVLAQKEAEMQNRLRQAILSRVLTIWTSKHKHIQHIDTLAINFHRTEIMEPRAMTYLDKLNWRLFYLQRQEQSAIALQERIWKTHVKNMLRYWAERAALAREQRFGQDDTNTESDPEEDDEDDDGSPSGAGRRGVSGDNTLARAEQWSTFDESAFDLGRFNLDLSLLPDAEPGGTNNDPIIDPYFASSTPLPGYLRTPSKRSTARAKARERLQTLGAPSGTDRRRPNATPAVSNPRSTVRGAATAPIPTSAAAHTPGFGRGGITPFERKLRAQGYSDRRLNSRTPGGFGRSVRGFGASVGFSDIPEDEGSGVGGT